MATRVRPWTLEEVHAIPDDGNRRELVDGVLIVTPPPAYRHEHIAARLAVLITPYVTAHDVGIPFRPRAVFRHEGSETYPDLMVRRAGPSLDAEWDELPLPSLVVEVLSPSTRAGDLVRKRELYMRAGIPEYWVVDPESRTMEVIRSDGTSLIVRDAYEWRPRGAPVDFVLKIEELFR